MTDERASNDPDEEPDPPKGEGDRPPQEDAEDAEGKKGTLSPLVKMPRLYLHLGIEEPARQLIDTVLGTQERQRLTHQLGEAIHPKILPPDLSLIIPKVEWPRLRFVARDIAARLPQAHTPKNWRGDKLDRPRLVELLEQGIAVVGVPPAVVLNELVTSAPGSRPAVLDANRDVILASCRASLNGVTSPDIKHQAGLLHECVTMAQSESTSGAQALAASVFDTLFRGIWRGEEQRDPRVKFRYKEAKESIPSVEIDEDAPLAFRVACALAPITVAASRFDDGDPIPSSFNRHASAHATGPEQYTPVNSLMAIMLAVSLVCEIHHGYLNFKPRS